MSASLTIMIVIAVICALIAAGGMKDWKESGLWDRTRIVIPALIAIILSAFVVTKMSGFERQTSDRNGLSGSQLQTASPVINP